MKKILIGIFTVALVTSCAHSPGSRSPNSLNDVFTSSSENSKEWLQWSGDLLNHHHRIVPNAKLTLKNVGTLHKKWEYATNSSIFGIPTVKDGVVYFGDIGTMSPKELFTGGGYLYAIGTDGKEVWKKAIIDYLTEDEKIRAQTHNKYIKVRNIARVSPAIAGDLLIIGTSINYMRYIWDTIKGEHHQIPGASVMAINRHNEELVWKTEIDPHFSSRVTMSPVVYKNQIFVGVSSEESQIPGFLGGLYKCCNFRGSLVSLDLNTGKVLWKTYTITEDAHSKETDEPGVKDFNGAAVWGSSPPIDEKRGRIYIASGNNYHSKKEMRDCLTAADQDLDAQKVCSQKFDHPGNHFDSILALNMKTGAIEWSFKSQIYDSWNVGCGSPVTLIPPKMPGACPRPAGIDSDFGQAPMLLQNVKMADGTTRDLVVDGNKAGMFYAIDAETTSANPTPVWTTQVSGGGALGGHEWGSASDGKLIFTQSTNLEHKGFMLTRGKYHGDGNHKVIHGGFWSAIDASNGEVVWQTPDPASTLPLKGEGITKLPLYGRNLGRGHFSSPIGPLTLYNDILFAGSLSGHLHAMNSKTGEIVWNYNAAGAGKITSADYYTTELSRAEVKREEKTSAVSAPAIVNDQLFWGLGYPLGTEDHRIISLGL